MGTHELCVMRRDADELVEGHAGRRCWEERGGGVALFRRAAGLHLPTSSDSLLCPLLPVVMIRKVLFDAFGTVFSPRIPVPAQYVSLVSPAPTPSVLLLLIAYRSSLLAP